MSTTNLIRGQQVRVTSPYNQFQPSNDTLYHVGAISRVNGSISVQLLQDGRSVGAIPENKLSPVK